MLHESITVERFTDSGLYLMLFILWIIITCTYAYDYFGKGILIGQYFWADHFYTAGIRLAATNGESNAIKETESIES